MKELTLCLPKAERERVTKQMERITNHRNRQVNHYLHAASKAIIDFLVEEGIGTLIIGKNPLWKQEAGMGKRNNQNFVQIPHARFIDMLTYKAAFVGIQVEIQEESYTSKASFLDLDPIPTYKPNDEREYTFSGKRIGRRNRLYRTKDGRVICADVNGSYNILRKSKPDAFACRCKGTSGLCSSALTVSNNRLNQTQDVVSMVLMSCGTIKVYSMWASITNFAKECQALLAPYFHHVVSYSHDAFTPSRTILHR